MHSNSKGPVAHVSAQAVDLSNADELVASIIQQVLLASHPHLEPRCSTKLTFATPIVSCWQGVDYHIVEASSFSIRASGYFW